jgi:hydroxymethylpyrimidine/phosphomethylpyrimidine kinase
VPTEFVVAQLETLVADVRLDAIKIGMLANADIVGAVGEFLRRHPHEHVVLDPVMVATSGDRLLDDDAVRAVRDLMPLASLITPNLAEAAVLLDTRLARTLPDLRQQAVALQEMGAQRVLIKGGHLKDGPEAVDLLLHLDGEAVLRAPRINTVNTHGTGCTLSSALAALRPQRDSWLQAALDAKSWLTAALVAADGLKIGHGHGPVHHFHEIWGR